MRPTRGWNRPGLRPGGKALGVFDGACCILNLKWHSRPGSSTADRYIHKGFVNLPSIVRYTYRIKAVIEPMPETLKSQYPSEDKTREKKHVSQSSSWRQLFFYFTYVWRFVVLQRQEPLIYGIALTDRCNLACRGCHVSNTGRRDMTWEQVVAAMQDAWRRRIPRAVLQRWGTDVMARRRAYPGGCDCCSKADWLLPRARLYQRFARTRDTG